MTPLSKLRALGRLVAEWRDAPEVLRAIAELATELAARDEPFVGRPLPEALVGGRLPRGIASAWVFVLRASQRNPAHVHPNSTQYTTAIRGGGTGTFGGDEVPLALFDAARPEQAIHVIPPGVPHSFATGRDGLVVISFHTVLPELLEELEVGSSRRRTYVEGPAPPFRSTPSSVSLSDTMTQSLQDRFAPHNRCFGCGPANEKGLRLKSIPAGDEVVCEWKPEQHHEAFEGMLNGGICGALLDCHSNWTAAWYLMNQSGAATPPCTVTAEFHVKLRKPTPSDGPVRLRARVVESSGSKAVVEATLEARGEVTCTCRGVFVAVKEGHPAFHRW